MDRSPNGIQNGPPGLKRKTAKQTVRAGRKAVPLQVVTNVLLPARLNDFLQKFGNESRRRGGYHLSKSEILRGLVRVMMRQLGKNRRVAANLFTEDDFVKWATRLCASRD